MKLHSASEALLPKTYEDVWYRGEAYVERGLVTIAKRDKKEIRALVRGRDEYIVSLGVRGSGLVKKCTCPYAAGGGNRAPSCKHMVAVAITWDEMREIDRPTREEIETRTIPPPLVSRFDIERAFQNPLTANLEIIRLAPGGIGPWTKPHERLPLMPEFSDNRNEPLTLQEVKRAMRILQRWTLLPGFDRYFCSGEMVAAFSEIVRIMLARSKATDPLTMGDLLLEAQKFHTTTLSSLIDDSDGLETISEAHLDELRDAIKKIHTPRADRDILEQKLWNYEVRKDS